MAKGSARGPPSSCGKDEKHGQIDEEMLGKSLRHLPVDRSEAAIVLLLEVVGGVEGLELQGGSEGEWARKFIVEISQSERSPCLATVLGEVRGLLLPVGVGSVLLVHGDDAAREELLVVAVVDVVTAG